MGGQGLSEGDALKSAELLHQQAEYLLNDEISYAAALKETRRTATTLLLVIVGIGVFRFDLYGPANGALSVPVWAAWAIRVAFLGAIALFILGGYLLHTERGMVDELVPSERTGGALSILYLKDSVLRQFEQRTPVEVMRMKTEGLRLAYQRLTGANRRVRGRLVRGTLSLFVGMALVLVAFGLYTLAVSPAVPAGR